MEFFSGLVCTLLPTSVVEAYVEEKKSGNGKLLAENLVSNIADISFDDGIRRNIAHCVGEGGKLITLQHGGVYGSQAFSFIEQLQIFNCDFYDVGWQDKVKKDRAAWTHEHGKASKRSSWRIILELG